MSLRQDVLAWLAADSDPETRAELADLLYRSEIDSSAADELRRRFEGRLRFGTAGLRARMGAGPTRMNRVVVRQVTAAVMASLPRDAKVVIGHDARKNSAVFASEAGRVVTAAGGCALMLGQVPTPVVAHAVGDRSAQAGVVITASHNPSRDNGYKLYAADGAQIVSPADVEVEALMSQIPPGSIHTLPQGVDADRAALGTAGLGGEAEGLGSEAHPAAGRIEVAGEAAIQRYLDAVVSHLTPCDTPRCAVPTDSSDRSGGAGRSALPCSPPTRPLRVVYTPLHGVGACVLLQLFERLGLPAPFLVDSQSDPNPEFPTLEFPNPEEPGALDAALALAETLDADLVLANDPDADRLAAAVAVSGVAAEPSASRRSDDRRAPRRWRVLTGDELGVLLADHLIRHPPRNCGDDPSRWLLAASLASSRMLRRLAQAAGASYAETLTGFKWIARAADARPERLLLGYEEALGYAVCDAVRDKDGLSAAALFVQLVERLRAEGSSPLARLDELFCRHGVHLTGQVSVGFEDSPSSPEEAVDRLRTLLPGGVAGWDVMSFVDLAASQPDSPVPEVTSPNSPEAAPPYALPPINLPPSNMLVFHLQHGDRVIVRPSGTEPKLKVYLEVVEAVDSRGLAHARSVAHRRLRKLEEAASQLVLVI